MKNNLTNLLFDRIKSRLPHRATADAVTTGGDEHGRVLSKVK